MTAYSDKPVHDVQQFRARRFALLMCIAGAVLLLLNFMLMASRPYADLPASSLTLPIIMIAVGIWRQCALYIDMQPDHMQVKLAPVMGWHTFLYSEIVGVQRKGNLCRIDYRRHDKPDSTPRQVKLKLVEMGSTERETFMYLLKQRLPENVTVK